MNKSPTKRAPSIKNKTSKKPKGAVEKAASPKVTKRTAPRKSQGKAATLRAGRAMTTRRADYGAPIDGFFARQPPHLRPILEALRKIVEEAAPDAKASIKWGMPFYTVGDTMMCALGSHKSHVNLILAGPPGAFHDPAGLLAGEGKTGRRLTLRSLEDLPRQAVRGWVRSARKAARQDA
jgi:hypothetical protein